MQVGKKIMIISPPEVIQENLYSRFYFNVNSVNTLLSLSSRFNKYIYFFGPVIDIMQPGFTIFGLIYSRRN